MERLVGKLFEKKGYDVKVTQRTGDSGIDVWAEKDGIKLGIQVKHWNADVGVVEATQTLGAGLGKAHKCILISTKSGFTPQALEYQQQNSHHIELWDTNMFRRELDSYGLAADLQPLAYQNDSKTSSIQHHIKPTIENRCEKSGCGNTKFDDRYCSIHMTNWASDKPTRTNIAIGFLVIVVPLAIIIWYLV